MSIIQCPNCKSPLINVGNTLKCSNGHNFDRAKEGYTNLILAHQKKKLSQGDNTSMVKAREQFLLEGHYDFLIEKIQTSIYDLMTSAYIDSMDGLTILDLGCGSGYYLRRIFSQSSSVRKFGIDISKKAIASASKRDANSTYLVGSAFKVPLIDNSLDIIMNIFAPCDLLEVHRILCKNGMFVKVIPSNNHMNEIASMVYDKFQVHNSTIEDDIKSLDGLSLKTVEEIVKVEVMKVDALRNLISMTPYIYKFSQEKMANLTKMSVTFSFNIIICQRE